MFLNGRAKMTEGGKDLRIKEEVPERRAKVTEDRTKIRQRDIDASTQAGQAGIS